MLALIVFLVGAATAVYFYYRRNIDFWPSKGIPIPPADFFYGHAKELFKLHEPRILKYKEWGEKYGKTYGTNEGMVKCLVTSDFNMLQEIFVKQYDNFYSRKVNPLGPYPDDERMATLFNSRGMRWKRLRAITAPSFSTNSLKKILPVVQDSVFNMMELMENMHSDGKPFNIHEFYMEYTMDTIGRLVIGHKESSYFNNPRVAVAKDMFLRNLDMPLLYMNFIFPFLNGPTKFLLDNMNNELARPRQMLFKEMGDAVHARIKKREANATDSATTAAEDFIDLFLEQAVDGIHTDNNSDFKLSQSHVEKNLTVNEVIGQAVVFLLAGFDTTANALGYTSWMLSKYPEIMKRCQEEVDEVCCEDNISFEDLNNLRYVEATCKETLRFYPLGGFASSRTCMKTTTVCGMEIEKGITIQADVYAIHFDKEIWGEDADEFKPERWLDADRRVPPMAYIPFGGGPRICVGMRLALMEEKLALANILRKFNIVKGTEASELDLQGSLTLTPVSVPVRIIPRE